MAAPKGNKFWLLRSKHGRQKIFSTPKLLWQEACKYFQWAEDNPWIKKEQLKKPITTTDEKGKKTTQTIVDIPTARPFLLSGLCTFLGVNEKYFNDFNDAISLKAKKGKLTRKDKDFSEVVHMINQIIYTQKFEGAAVGAFNANIIARSLGLTDKKDITSGGEKLPQPQTIIRWGDKEISI
jgi:hypothetical protein